MKQETIVSGIRATGKLHIGNYLGALKQFIELQNSTAKQGFFFIADLHALTTPFNPKELRQQTLEVVADYIAGGLDPEKSTIFLQNQISEHTELAWIFECITPLGELERMTQFKDKAGYKLKVVRATEEEIAQRKLENPNLNFDKDENVSKSWMERAEQSANRQIESVEMTRARTNTGLLAYPVLMASDILLYKPSMVPVGDDQTQHLELTRTIARKFNKQFGHLFPEPKNYLLKPLRIMSLKHPEKKMSKTNDEPLYLDDAPKTIQEKIKKAVTATSGNGESLGAENLLYLLSQFGTQEHISYFANDKKNGSIKYSELKESLAEDIANYFADFREKKKELLAKPDKLAQILGDGAQRARKVAVTTLSEVKQKIGLL